MQGKNRNETTCPSITRKTVVWGVKNKTDSMNLSVLLRFSGFILFITVMG
ncbi:hypothetical protein A1Q_4719 [Vibrio campbellii HY01]|nr:hypothetical protein A1Q_4719 [Vibrio campbellii HY01]